MTLSPKARRAAAELQDAIREGRTKDVLSLIREFGLSDGDRIAVACELDRPEIDYDRVEFGYSRTSDEAFVRGLPEVWRKGVKKLTA